MPLRTYAVLGALLFSGAAQAIPIDLNDFFFFPGDPVTVAPDGSSALIEDVARASPIVLENDPAAGDPGLLVAAPEVILSEGEYYLAALLPSLKGIRIARLNWEKAP